MIRDSIIDALVWVARSLEGPAEAIEARLPGCAGKKHATALPDDPMRALKRRSTRPPPGGGASAPLPACINIGWTLKIFRHKNEIFFGGATKEFCRIESVKTFHHRQNTRCEVN
jgi:hypothetical protein